MANSRIRWLCSRYAAIVLMLAIVGFSCVMAQLGLNVRRASRQRDARRALESMGALVWYDWQDEYVQSPYPRWVEDLVGEDFFADIIYVLILDKPITAYSARQLGMLGDVETMTLLDCQLQDEHLAELASLQALSSLTLSRTNVTDTGLRHICFLCGLEQLQLDGTRIARVYRLRSFLLR